MGYIHIKPTFDCLIKIEDLEMVLDKNKTYSFLSKNNLLNVIVYPISNNSTNLPFCFMFNETLPFCQKNVEVIVFPDNNYLLTIFPFTIGSPKLFGEKSKQLTFGGETHTLTYSLNSPFNIKLECNKTFCEHSFNKTICSLETKVVNNNLLIYAKIQKELGFIFCNITYENENYNLITLEKVDILEDKNDCILTYKKLNDISHHGEVCKYSKQNYNKISYLVYDNNSPIIVKHKEFIPFAFFEAIKLKNFKLARSYLSQTLSKKLSNAHLKNFFGNFVKVCFPITQEEFYNEIALVYEENKNLNLKKYAKIFKIELESNNKISNVFEQWNTHIVLFKKPLFF